MVEVGDGAPDASMRNRRKALLRLLLRDDDAFDARDPTLGQSLLTYVTSLPMISSGQRHRPSPSPSLSPPPPPPSPSSAAAVEADGAATSTARRTLHCHCITFHYIAFP